MIEKFFVEPIRGSSRDSILTRVNMAATRVLKIYRRTHLLLIKNYQRQITHQLIDNWPHIPLQS